MAAGTSLSLPALGPIAPERPAEGGFGEVQVAMASLSYAQDSEPAASAFAGFDGLDADPVVRSWKRMNGNATVAEPYMAAGSFTEESEAKKLAGTLAAFGRTADRGNRDRWRHVVRRQPAWRRPLVDRRAARGRLVALERRTPSPSATDPPPLAIIAIFAACG